MKKLLATCLMASSTLAWAAGADGGIPPVAKAYLDRIDINPIALRFATVFKSSARGITDPNPRGPVWNPEIKLNEPYECEVFWILKDPDLPLPLETQSQYHFKPFGNRLLKNLAASENIGNVKTFGEDPISLGDLIGRSDDRSYFEAVRTDFDGSLLVEIQTKEYYYIKYILQMIGGSAHAESFTLKDFQSHNPSLAIPPVLEQNAHLVLGYGYCPFSTEAKQKLQLMKTSSYGAVK